MFRAWGDCVENGIATLRCIPVVFQNLISAALVFVGIVTAFLIVWAGIKFAGSGGDPKQIDQAKKILTYAILGLILVLSSFAIIYFISYSTGNTCITKMSFDC